MSAQTQEVVPTESITTETETETETTRIPTNKGLFLPDSVPEEFKDNTFLQAIRSAKQTLGSVETGLSAKSEFELYYQTGSSKLDLSILQKRAQNVDIRYSK
eukprot:415890_1